MNKETDDGLITRKRRVTKELMEKNHNITCVRCGDNALVQNLEGEMRYVRVLKFFNREVSVKVTVTCGRCKRTTVLFEEKTKL